MIILEFIAPQLSDELQKKANNYLTQMTAMIDFAKKKPDYSINKFKQYFATEKYENRLINNFFVGYQGKPKEGSTDSAEWQAGFRSDAFASEIYASPMIKQAIIQSSYGRCAYCETLIHQSQYGDVEHFRPKSAYVNDIEEALNYPGYYWLAYSPENLLFSCATCNEAYKKNYFPIRGVRAQSAEDNLLTEHPVFINPYTENPRNVIRFSALTGKAYGFDLISKFYEDTQGFSHSQTEEHIWTTPSAIPEDYLTYCHTSIIQTDDETSMAYRQWLQTQSSENNVLTRGIRLIQLLGLNRPSLIRARLSTMRGLIGLYTSAIRYNSESAKQAISPYSSPGTNNATAGEYISCGIDVLQTCDKSNIGTEPLLIVIIMLFQTSLTLLTSNHHLKKIIIFNTSFLGKT